MSEVIDMIPGRQTPDNLPVRFDWQGDDFIVTMPDGEERHFTTFQQAQDAAGNGGELPGPVNWLAGYTLEERRAALARVTAPDGRTRNPLTGHFTGGDRGDR